MKIRELTEELSRYDGLYSEEVKLLVEIYTKYCYMFHDARVDVSSGIGGLTVCSILLPAVSYQCIKSA